MYIIIRNKCCVLCVANTTEEFNATMEHYTTTFAVTTTEVTTTCTTVMFEFNHGMYAFF